MTGRTDHRQSSLPVGQFCQGCGAELPPKTWKGRDRKWCSQRCRKRTLYSGTCATCGTPTNGYSGPGLASDECGDCRARRLHNERHWTPDAIIDAIKRWASERDGMPPTATDWNSPLARERGRPARSSDYPPLSTVQREFGTWTAAIEAAGFDARPSGRYGRNGDDPAIRAQAVELYASGVSSVKVAAQLRVDADSVLIWSRAAGVEVRGPGGGRRAA